MHVVPLFSQLCLCSSRKAFATIAHYCWIFIGAKRVAVDRVRQQSQTSAVEDVAVVHAVQARSLSPMSLVIVSTCHSSHDVASFYALLMNFSFDNVYDKIHTHKACPIVRVYLESVV
jgi:hypothetical protein